MAVTCALAPLLANCKSPQVATVCAINSSVIIGYTVNHVLIKTGLRMIWLSYSLFSVSTHSELLM